MCTNLNFYVLGRRMCLDLKARTAQAIFPHESCSADGRLTAGFIPVAGSVCDAVLKATTVTLSKVWHGGAITLLPTIRASPSCSCATVSLHKTFTAFIINFICQGRTYHLEVSAVRKICKERLCGPREPGTERESERARQIFMPYHA